MYGQPTVACTEAGQAPRPSADERAKTRGEVVFAFSYLSWDAAAKRGWFGTEDRLARALVEHERVRRALICDRARSLPLKLARDLVERRREPFPAGADRRLLSPTRLRRADPASPRAAARAFERQARAMERAARAMGLSQPALITTQPLLAGLADLSWARTVTYYALDDWAVHPGYRRWWDAYAEAYELIRRRGHRVAAVSADLLTRLRPQGEAAVVANGLDPREWRSRETERNGDTDSPLLVYVGTLDARLDVEWLTQIARELPRARILLVGPPADAGGLDPLRREANVTISPALPRDRIARLLMSADLGLVPHRRNQLTEAMSPLKLYEYLAAGLPVVATDLAPMRGVDSRVLLVPEGGDFATAARFALALGRAPEREREAFVRENSWQRRHEALLDLALA